MPEYSDHAGTSSSYSSLQANSGNSNLQGYQLLHQGEECARLEEEEQEKENEKGNEATRVLAVEVEQGEVWEEAVKGVRSSGNPCQKREGVVMEWKKWKRMTC